MSAGMASRLRRLESRQQRHRARRQFILAVYPSEGARELVGVSSGVGGHSVARLPGESLSALFARATVVIPEMFMIAEYANPIPLSRRPAEQCRHVE